MSNNTTYATVTDKIIALIESDGVAPWQKSWNLAEQAPRSMSTSKRYQGINTWLLLGFPYTSPWWGTYKQISALGGQVRKGEKSTLVVFWKMLPVGDPASPTGKKTIPFLRTFLVFNAEQADGLPDKFYSKPNVDVQPTITEAHDAFTGYMTREGIKLAKNNPAYQQATDTIFMPDLGDFQGEADYLSTAFHEAGHSTGHKDRLNRPDLVDWNGFGSHSYSREELVAEFTAAMLSAHFGFTTDRLAENQAAYLKHWVKVLKDDPQMLVWAAGRAEKAADYVLVGKPQDDTTSTEEE